jgi:hypothetical protein
LITRHIITKELKNDDNFSDLVTSWVVESKLSNEEFKDYSPALHVFNRISKQGTQVILYEIKKNPADGSTIKKTPLLNSKKTKTKPPLTKRSIYSKAKDKSASHPRSKNIFKGYKARIFLLIIILLTFIAILFFMNSISGELQKVSATQYLWRPYSEFVIILNLK